MMNGVVLQLAQFAHSTKKAQSTGAARRNGCILRTHYVRERRAWAMRSPWGAPPFSPGVGGRAFQEAIGRLWVGL